MLNDGQRLAAYLQNSAHQMRTPLTVLKTYLELLQAEVYGPVTTEMMERLDALEVNVDELSYFVDQAQDMGLLTAGQYPAPVTRGDLTPLVEGAISELSSSARSRHIGVVLESPEAPVVALFDPILARKALVHMMHYIILTAPVHAEVRAALKRGQERSLIVVFGFGELVSGPEMERILDGMTEIETSLTNTDWERLSLPLSRRFMEMQGGDLTIFNDESDRTVYVLEFKNRDSQ
jgi:K+-sensing histidine kinase KdpD